MDLLEPLQHAFMRDALLVGTVIASMCAVLSCYVILKGWSLMGDAISHAVLPGIVIAYIAGLPLTLGAFVSGLTCAAGTGLIRRNSRLKEDTVLGVVFTGMFAFGLVIFSRTASDLHLNHILFGTLLGIPRAERLESLVLSGLVIVIALVLRRDFLLVCFDPVQARVVGLRERLLGYGLLCLLSLATVIALKAAGVILAVALLITPGAVAHLWTDRFDRMLAVAVATGAGGTIAGLFVSFRLGADTGACIVLAQASIFAVTWVFAPKHGLLAHRRQRRASERA